MNIKCLFAIHDWRFAYNHGMPFGIGAEEALNRLNTGKSYTVFECTRCHKQTRATAKALATLDKSDREKPLRR